MRNCVVLCDKFILLIMSQQGPCGNIKGMRWCGETNRYYAESGSGTQPSAYGYPETPSVGSQESPLDQVRHTPVTERLLQSLPGRNKKRSRAQSEDCSICLRNGVDQRADPRMRFVTLPCSHAFHFYCAAQWLTKRSGCCPTCRTPVDSSLATAAISTLPRVC
jgi:hypothetical protein